MITNDGIVKILDFGLAQSKDISLSSLSSYTRGTISYMSPEQITGNHIDQQTDIWSLAVILYEMLTGELPFKGEYDQAVIYSTLNNKADLSLIKNSALRNIIIKCLQKETSGRYKSISEILKIRQLNDRGNVKHPGKINYTGTLLSILGVIIIAGIIFYYNTTIKTAKEIVKMKTIRLTSFAGEENDPSISPDGKSIAFSWNGLEQNNFDIYVKLVDTGSPLRLTSNQMIDKKPEWSSDGKFIAFAEKVKI